MTKRSPLAPDRFPDMPAVAGVRLGTRACALRYQGRDDLFVAEMDAGTAVAGVLTRSQTASAPVDWCRKALMGGRARVLVVNSGNANAFTGSVGENAVSQTIEAARGVFSSEPGEVFVASTGVIGERLPVEKIVAALADIRTVFPDTAWEAAARAIMTTDTYPKGSTCRVRVGDVDVTLCGIAKGSGMIAPNMATMLAFVFTDAAIAPGALHVLLSASVDRSFNCTTVDGDTSTSDTVLLFATGAAGGEPVNDPADPQLTDFRAALDAVTLDLAQQVVRDGEGAAKFITITVTGAEHNAAAKNIGLSIANSPLVKTAVAGEDANWGRIVMAAGKAGERVDRSRLSIRVGGISVAEKGEAAPGYDETPVAAHMKGTDVSIAVDVGVGDGEATVWTCDLTHGYIDINADYRS